MSSLPVVRYKKRFDISKYVKHFLFIIVCVICLYPMFLVLGISFSDELEISRQGFNLIPAKFSLVAYNYILTSADSVLRSYGITILNTVVGTLLSTLVIALFAYPLSRKDFKQRKFFNGINMLCLLFSGGMIPWIIVCTQIIGLQDNYLAFILPYLMSAWYVVIMRTFFRTSVADSMIESAKIDGAGEWRIFFQIVIHLAAPGLATIALFNTIIYWNDFWINMTLINDPNMMNLQYLMARVQINIQYLSANSGNLGTAAAEIVKNLPSRTAQMAMTILAIGPIVMAYPFFQRYFVKGITLGSLKE